MKIINFTMAVLFAATLILSGCGSDDNLNAPLNAEDINLIFVASPDLAYNDPGDIDTDTANLTEQGLNRSLQMATFLKQQVLGEENVTAIYTLSPMTHLQTDNDYPDMTAIGYIQQFALLNQNTLRIDEVVGTTYTANSYPLNVSYPSQDSLPSGVAVSLVGNSSTERYPNDCSGLDFNNTDGVNDTLVSTIIENGVPGYFVFSAPWETISALLSTLNEQQGYNLNIPTSYRGANHVYTVSLSPQENASLVHYNSNLTPPDTYPVLPSAVTREACTNSQQDYFYTSRSEGVDGVSIPSDINTNQTIYIVRHAEAHPNENFKFENGNFVAAGQWRALELPNVLSGVIEQPDMVYSIDPAQWFPAQVGEIDVSYVRPSLTVLPYAIANHLPYSLVSSFSIIDHDVAQLTSDYFFTEGTFSNQTILLGWESGRIRPFINALISSYGGNSIPQLPVDPLTNFGWPADDYNTIWTITIDGQGSLTVENDLCEGIDSTLLPATAPQF